MHYEITDGFTKVSNTIVRCGRGMSHKAKLVLIALLSCKPCHPGMGTLRDWTGLSRSAVAEAINELIARGIVLRESGAESFSNNRYRVRPENEWDLSETPKRTRPRQLELVSVETPAVLGMGVGAAC